MRNLFYLAIAILTFSCAKSTTEKQSEVVVPPSAPEITYTGRILWNDSTAPEFSYPGTSASLSFYGPSIAMLASPGSGYFMVGVDDNKLQKINFTENDSIIVIADSLGDGLHGVKVIYAMEGFEKNPHFKGFIIGEGGKVASPQESKPLKIEFIGNSITCGYGTEAENENVSFSYDTENHTLTYAFITANNLDAEYNVVARSGIGIYRNYGDSKDGSVSGTMPMEYDNTLLYNNKYKWDHSSFEPDIICINLGTNDTSLNNYDIKKFETEYAKFVTHLQDLHPNAKIVLLTGSMMSGKSLADVKNALDNVAKNNPQVYRFDMTPQTGELGYGGDWHPSRKQHQKMADELTSFLQSIITK